MPDVHISVEGIEKLLKGLNPYQAGGPEPT